MPEPGDGADPLQRSRSQSFVVRLWSEDLGHGRREWRGSVQQVSTQDVRYFRGLERLLVCVEAMLRGGDVGFSPVGAD